MVMFFFFFFVNFMHRRPVTVAELQLESHKLVDYNKKHELEPDRELLSAVFKV